MKINFGKHARDQLRERKIDRSVVIHTIRYPDNVKRQPSGRYLAMKQIASKLKQYVLVVAYEKKGDIITVITTFITSKVKKYS